MGNIGLFAIDAGGSTGLAWGVVPKGAHPADVDKRTIKTATVRDKSEVVQVRSITRMFNTWVKEVNHRVDGIEIIIEDFVLRPGPHAGGKEGTSSIRIAWGITGFLMGQQQFPGYPIWQTPSEVLGTVTKDRLKEWGLWVVGQEHERDAMSHLAFRMLHHRIRAGIKS